MGRKKTRALETGTGFSEKNQLRLFFVLGRGVLGCRIGAGCFMHARGSFVFLTDFLNQATSYEVLELLVGPQAQHFLAAANGVAHFQIRKNALKQIVETEDLFFSKNVAKLIGDMIWKATGESGAFRSNCHNEVIIHPSETKATQIF